MGPISEANLVELMFAHKRGMGGRTIAVSAAAAFEPMLEMFRRGQSEGGLGAQDPERICLIFLATLQGLAGLVTCGVIQVGQLDGLIETGRGGQNTVSTPVNRAGSASTSSLVIRSPSKPIR